MCTYIWNDDKFPFASDDCQLVWFHIFTNPLSSPLGVFRASLAGLAEDKNRNGAWPFDRYKKAFDEALQEGFIRVDHKALLISFPKYFSPRNVCNHPQSPNVVTSWGERFHDLPSSPLKDECYQSLEALLKGYGEAFRKAFDKAFAKVSPNTDSLFLIPEPEPKKSIPARKPVQLTDDEFMESLKGSPAYRHINFEIEDSKMDHWLGLPKNKHRKKTRQFILNWLNKIEKPISSNGIPLQQARRPTKVVL